MIQVPKITKLDLRQIQDAINTLARNSQSLQNPGGQEDAIYTDVAPTVASLAEGQEKYYINGATIRKYTKLAGTIRYWTLT